MAFKLTLEAVKREGLKAYEENRLTAQHPNPKGRVCVYSTKTGFNLSPEIRAGDEYVCVIGAALPEEVRHHPEAYGGVTSLIHTKLVEVDPHELDGIIRIQNAHDFWARRHLINNDVIRSHYFLEFFDLSSEEILLKLLRIP